MRVVSQSKLPLADLERGKVLTQATTRKGFRPPHHILLGEVTYNHTITIPFKLSDVWKGTRS